MALTSIADEHRLSTLRSLAQGYTLIEVAELLGHSQISTTRRYAHLQTRLNQITMVLPAIIDNINLRA